MHNFLLIFIIFFYIFHLLKKFQENKHTFGAFPQPKSKSAPESHSRRRWPSTPEAVVLPEVTDAIEGDIAPLLVTEGDVSTSSTSWTGSLGNDLGSLGLGSAVDGDWTDDNSSDPRAYSKEFLRTSNRPIKIYKYKINFQL